MSAKLKAMIAIITTLLTAMAAGVAIYDATREKRGKNGT